MRAIGRRRRGLRALFAAGILGLLVLGVQVDVSRAQFAPITFPDTAVGSTATVKCPETTVSICFGGPNCSGTGTIQSVSGPGAPFAVGKFNVLSNAEFFGGNCEAHPVSLPATLASGQIFAFQATFAPSSPGTFNGTVTFNTPGGPASVPLTGKGVASQAGGGTINVRVNDDNFSPGSLFDLRYETRHGSLQGPVDIYFAIVFPGGSVLFLNGGGVLGGPVVPFRTNVSVADATIPIVSIPVPTFAQFGDYTIAMALVAAGKDANDSTNWVSAVSIATFTYSPLSTEQRALIQSRGGNPDFLAMTWVEEQSEKRETWVYLSGAPTVYRFLNGKLDSQAGVAPAGGGPRIDPERLSPQTTKDQLIGTFGPPASVTTLPGAPEFEVVRYASGLSVVLRNGFLSSASTTRP